MPPPAQYCRARAVSIIWFSVGQIDNLYTRFVHLLIAKGGSSGQDVDNSGFNACEFC